MRPIDKGEAPETEFKKYQDAGPYLEKRIGAYCSYCEFPLDHVPEVEHKEAKARGGNVLEWKNLLLSCKYCNTRKGTKVGAGDKGKYLWPDEDDTFHPFLYDKTGVPKLNEEYLREQGEEVRQKAVNLYNLLKLGEMPTLKNKDRRFWKRNEARTCALRNKARWEKVKQSPQRALFLDGIAEVAKNTGFFSTWMDVFQDDLEVKEVLVHAFVGTRREYCLEDNT